MNTTMLVMDFIKKIGYLVYLMNPKEHLFESVKDVPDYFKEITPAVFIVIAFEQIVKLIQGKKLIRLNDSVTNICQGILVELFKIPLLGVELILYTWIYNNFRIITLPWDSVLTWICALVVHDLGFYWMHRATHQISILWLFHEPHHSSEEFNLTVPLRLSVFTSASLWLTYLPMALAVPPSIFLVHYQMNTVFQYWLHSELITSLGPIEKIFVTPSHHRVHHGRNPRCIDKNYGSVFSFWDKIFGTYEPEGTEKIVYGVTKPIQTFNPFYLQMNHLQSIWIKFNTVSGFWNKMSAVCKGPGWEPGTPWCGNLEDIPEPKETEKKYDPQLPVWLDLYVLFHASALILGFLPISLNLQAISKLTVYACGCYMVLTTLALGFILDASSWYPMMELCRCSLYFCLDMVIQREFEAGMLLSIYTYFFRTLFFTSLIFWLYTSPFIFRQSDKKTF